jgi:cytochrome d ubiquinol oxidase subunit II
MEGNNMFETLSHLALQQYWWVIVSLLGSVLVFLMFVQGGQTLIFTLGKSEDEHSLLVNSLGRKWEFTFTTLVTFGGAFFASFPLFYSTCFGGAYWVWMVILFAFVLQAVSYEFRSKPNNFLGRKTYEIFLFINGSLGTILIGTTLATFFTGSQFSVNEFHFSKWEGPARGLELVLNIRNLVLGFTVFFLARVLAIQYFMNNIDDDIVFQRAKKHLLYNAVPFVVLFLVFVIRLLLTDGFAYDPQTKYVSTEPYKYLHNLLQMPIVLVMFICGTLLVFWGIISSALKVTRKGIWFTGPGTVLTIWTLFFLAGFNHTAFYPSTYDLQSSLTIENASSSHYTLTAMSYVSLLVPFVLAYIIYDWKSINKTPVNKKELAKETHVY